MPRKKTNGRLPKSKGIDTATVYSPAECKQKVKRIVFQETNKQIVEEFIAIQGMKERFEEEEVPMPNKIVMFGPPGTGKTLTAFYIAHRLELPLILVRLDAIIHSHLGETGSNIRKVFDFAQTSPCVLFLDEFDAIARARDASDEVKEMARVVNTLLQCLDEFDGESIFIAATNLQEDLDSAVWRRFDTKMTYTLPNDKDCSDYVSMLMGHSDDNESIIQKVVQLLKGCSYADIEQIILKAKRKVIIENSSMTYEKIFNAFVEYNPKVQV
ncbi:AAA family ATPase [Paenibacillus sedimenti]|uniref:ATP-binding protein n=1 Tax=Paenibacillus sedimenti TaxID=2770274 RepID=A0A926QM32_9BACL|nr:ATP-binding protein [Paenibacillus sedimenti]MBD0382989.1 ATP-binding protein [Paenibacillus sedimenti]